MARGRGGKRTPDNPAPTSGPGALARRTDGGPAGKPPVPPGQPYGQRRALEEVQARTPSPSDLQGTLGGAPAAAPTAAGGAPGLGPDPFGESMRPDEPGDFGLMTTPDTEPLPATVVLQELHKLYPSPWIARLLGRTDALR